MSSAFTSPIATTATTISSSERRSCRSIARPTAVPVRNAIATCAACEAAASTVETTSESL